MSAAGDNSSLASSLTDLMTSLAVIFILLLVASLNNIKTSDTRNQILQRLSEMFREFEAKGVRVEKDPADPLTLLVLIPEKDLLEFAFDKSEISQGGIEFLHQFTPRLSETVCGQFQKEISSIVVEGHADSLGTDKANLDRSQQRSSAVVIESLNALQGIQTHDCFRGLVSATGRGSADPIKDASGREDADRSRRVVFKIRIRSLEQRELQEIIGTSSAAAAAR
jgi:outer membrane protein OmpA-like peptidoglycan-associated protein